MNNHVTVLEIDGKALEHNLHYFKDKLHQKTKVLAVVKAFGYGSDGVQVASFLRDKVNYFAVAYAHEGEALRVAEIATPILVLHPQIQNFDQIVFNQLEPSIYNLKTLTAFLAYAKDKELIAYPIHLKFNTGLNRLGISKEEIRSVMGSIRKSKHVKIKSILSHLAASEDLNEQDFSLYQIGNFKQIIHEVCGYLNYTPMAHILNTSGVINYPEAQFDMVRIGIGLYGFGNNKTEIITTNDFDFAERCKVIRNHGCVRNPAPIEGIDFGVNCTYASSNYRMPELSAVVGVSQIPWIDNFVAKRNVLASAYDLYITNPRVTKPKIPANTVMTWWQYIISLPTGTTLDDRTNLCTLLLKEHGIATANAYWPACHEQPAFLKYVENQTYPIADNLLKRHLALPLYVEMDLEQVKFVSNIINKVV